MLDAITYGQDCIYLEMKVCGFRIGSQGSIWPKGYSNLACVWSRGAFLKIC